MEVETAPKTLVVVSLTPFQHHKTSKIHSEMT